MNLRFLQHTAIAVSLVSAAPAAGHHSNIGFYGDGVMVFEGLVTRFDWTNPHVYLYVESEDSDGRRIEWELETLATSRLARSGWTPDSLRPGQSVTVRANPPRDASLAKGLILSVETGSGDTLLPGAYRPQSGTTAVATDLSGVWEGARESRTAFVKGLLQVPLTSKATAATEEYDIRVDSPAARCIATNPPFTTISVFYLHEIELQNDIVLIRNEFFDIERTVYMDGRGHPANGQRTNQGHSIGRWEGDVLIVDTNLFAANRSPYGDEGIPSGEQKHVIESFRLSDDRTRMNVDLVLEDPEFLAEPYSGTVEWNYTPHHEMLSFGCDPEASRRFATE